MADQLFCVELLDRDAPITEVLTLKFMEHSKLKEKPRG